uniref:BRCT domain-containing protein n=1 Tax=Panagrellus redivivus TaxID=6233 RepID=A0A7E4W094_PANRE
MSEGEGSTSIDAGSSSAAPLSPEKSLFGNSADILRQSDIESMIHGEEETAEVEEASNEEQSNVATESTAQPPAASEADYGDIIPQTQELNDVLPDTDDEADGDTHEKQPAAGAGGDADEPMETEDGGDEAVVDSAGEEPCVKRHVEPVYEEEDNADESEAPAAEEAEEKPAEEVQAEAPEEEEEEPIVTPHRRTPRSAAATQQSTKAKRGAKKARTQSESDFEEPEAAAEPEPEPEPQPEESTPRRRSTRVSKPVITPPAAKTPAKGRGKAVKVKKEEKSEEPEAKPEPTPKKGRGRKKKTPTPAVSEAEDEAEAEPEEAETEPAEVEVTPKKTRGRKKKVPTPVVSEAEDEGEAEPTAAEDEPMEVDEEEPQESPVSTRRGRGRRSTRTSTTVTPTPKKTPAKRGRQPKREPSTGAESQTETDVQTESAATTPRRRPAAMSTPKRGAKTPKREADEFELPADSPGPSSSKTPKRGAAKRPPTDTPSSSKVKRGKHRRSPSPDPNDPYNFDTKQDEHPVMFQNVGIVRNNFMNLNFFTSKKEGDTSSKYAALEKNASERRSMLPALLLNSTPTTSKTPRAAAKKTPGRKRALKTESINGDDVNEGETPAKKTPRARNTPAPTPKVEKKLPPVLTPEEQQQVDAHEHFDAGARVYAFWNKQYYSAVLSERDGLSRWNVIYTEDNSDNFVPFDSLMALRLVTVGAQVSVLGDFDDDGYQDVFVGEVKAIPNIEDANEWYEGLYSIEVHNDETPKEIRQIKWNNIFFNTKDFKALRKNAKNATSIDTDNVIESKRTRRSCVAAPAPPPLTPAAAKRGKGAKKTPTRKTSTREPSSETVQEEHEESVLSETSNGHQPIFAGKTFILTAATRGDTEPPFHKKSLKRQIENRGGRVIDALTDVADAKSTYIIADTFYRTSKYLGALSMSIPPVSFKWILESIESEELKNPNDYFLPAGIVEGSDQVVPFRPSTNVLGGLRIAVYNWCPRDNMNFRQVWAPIINNLGGVYVELPDSVADVIDALKNAEEPIDYMVVEEGCDYTVVDAAYEVDATPVRADWLTHAILTGEMDNTDRYFIPREDEDEAEDDGEEEAAVEEE